MPAPERITLATLAPLPCWVAWQVELRTPTDKKPTKVPRNPRTGGKAMPNNASTWGTRDAAKAREACLTKPFDMGGVGMMFGPLQDGRHLSGVDLDRCRNPETGIIEPWAQEWIDKLASYAEVSPSGTGVKVFFLHSTADRTALRNGLGIGVSGKPKHARLWARRAEGDHPPAIELHLSNRFFAVTDAILEGGTDELREVPTVDLLHLIKVDGPAFIGDDDEADAATEAQERPTSRSKRNLLGQDRSRSAIAFGVGKRAVQEGATFDAMCQALRDNAETAEWMADKGEADGKREAHRIFDKATASGPLIQVVAGELHTITTAAEDAILTAGMPIYQRGNDLVQPASREVPAAKGRTTLAAGLGEINAHALIDVLCGVAEWERYDARSEAWVRTNPPRQVADILLSRHGRWRFPPIAGVVTTPTMRADGTILSAPGYDAETRLFHVADPDLTLHPAVAAPTRQHAEAALAALSGLLKGFPFVVTKTKDEPDQHVSHAVALSALITPVVRGAISVAPAHAFRANTAGSGKSYLADTASAIATGRPCPVISAAPGDEAETEKRITGLLLAGFPIISLDNVNGELGGDLLCQAIERPLVRVRPLGRSEIVEIESRSTIFCTGNQLRVRGDMVRRTLVSDLDAGVERPEERQFSFDPVATILADRSRYVSACLIIVRAYLLAGSPGKLPPVASFEEWSALVRSALVWLGCADPALSMKAAREDDPELGDLREMMEAWRNAFGSIPTTCRAAIDGALEKVAKPDDAENQYATQTEIRFPGLQDALTRVAGFRGIVDPARLGRWLLGREGRIVGIERFKRDGITGGSMRWKLEVLRGEGG